jgi:hypothetical protein
MKRILLVCLSVTMLSLKACQMDDSIAQYQLNQTSSVQSEQTGILSTDQIEAATREFSGNLYDDTFGGNIIVDGYLVFCNSRPDPELERDLLASDPQYLILSNSESSAIQTFIDQVLNNLYIMNYTNIDDKKNQENRGVLFSPDIAQLVNVTLDSQVNVRSNVAKYNLITDISVATILPKQFVAKFNSYGGDTIYRVWCQFPMSIVSAADNENIFFEYNQQFYNGDTMIDVWMYIRVPSDMNMGRVSVKILDSLIRYKQRQRSLSKCQQIEENTMKNLRNVRFA